MAYVYSAWLGADKTFHMALEDNSYRMHQLKAREVTGPLAMAVKRAFATTMLSTTCGMCGANAMLTHSAFPDYDPTPEKLGYISARLGYCIKCRVTFVECRTLDGRMYFSSTEDLWSKPVELTGKEILATEWYGRCLVGVMNQEGLKAGFFGVRLLNSWLSNIYGLDVVFRKQIIQPLAEAEKRFNYTPWGKYIWGEPDGTRSVVDGDKLVMLWRPNHCVGLGGSMMGKPKLTDYLHSYFGTGTLNLVEAAVFVDFPLLFNRAVPRLEIGMGRDEMQELISTRLHKLFPGLPTVKFPKQVRAEIENVLASLEKRGVSVLKGIWG